MRKLHNKVLNVCYSLVFAYEYSPNYIGNYFIAFPFFRVCVGGGG